MAPLLRSISSRSVPLPRAGCGAPMSYSRYSPSGSRLIRSLSLFRNTPPDPLPGVRSAGKAMVHRSYGCPRKLVCPAAHRVDCRHQRSAGRRDRHPTERRDSEAAVGPTSPHAQQAAAPIAIHDPHAKRSAGQRPSARHRLFDATSATACESWRTTVDSTVHLTSHDRQNIGAQLAARRAAMS